ncbi:MAG: hypothetical protein ACI4EW_03105 [Butyrivibrio sp.]
MRFVKAGNENAKKALVTALLIKRDWIICVTANNPDDPATFILENVTRFETWGHVASIMENPVFIEYGISPSKEGSQFPYRIHDSLMTPVKNLKMLTDLVDFMIRSFDVFIIEEDMVDRRNVYGKLLTDHADEIVFVNEF